MITKNKTAWRVRARFEGSLGGEIEGFNKLVNNLEEVFGLLEGYNEESLRELHIIREEISAL